MKYFYTCFVLMAFVTASFGDNNPGFYYADGERINLHRDNNTLVLHFAPQWSERAALIDMPGLESVEVHDVQGRALLIFNREVRPSEFNPAQFSIPAADFYSAVNGFKLDDGMAIALTHDVVVEFPGSKGPADGAISALAQRYNATYDRNEYGVDVYRVVHPLDGLAFANMLEEGNLANWAHPDFYAKITRHNDPFYSQQFQMNNTGQVVNGFAGLSGIDCNAQAAWAVTTGLTNLTVAVIDDGLEAHEDLTAGAVSRVLAGHTPITGGNGTPRFSTDAHGMACAGIVAATHNNSLGIRGVAPGARLRSVNIFWGGESTQSIANGINWARTQGVDIMSNSWSYTSCVVSFTNINSALATARTQGRGGKGCIIVFSSGNEGLTCLNYPSNRPDVIAVGAVTNQGQWSTYSNRGPQLSLVAPSSPGEGQPGAFVRTIDRMGANGYDASNYTPFFGGTSAACPVVAGVAALVISANPDLTEAQVRDVLQTTATDMGVAGFDNTFGYGRVNAGAAVAAAVTGGSCQDELLTLNILLDNFPGETTWQLATAAGAIVTTGGNYAGTPGGTVISTNICVPEGCYVFTIFDAFGDGICCTFGSGSYTLLDSDGAVLASGGQFTFNEATSFCIGDDGPPACALPYPTVDDLGFIVNTNNVKLTWTAIQGSTFCEIQGGLNNPNGQLQQATINQSNLSQFTIPGSQFPISANYRVRVRCGCSTNPSVVGDWSPFVVFFFTKPSVLAQEPGGIFQAISGEYAAPEVRTFPNPTQGVVHLEVTLPEPGEVKVRLFDLVGKEVHAHRQFLEAGMQQLHFDYGNLEPAIYLMQVTGDNGLSSAVRLVVQR